MFAAGETVIRQRATLVVDPYSGETEGLSWDSPDELSISGCGYNPGGSTEPTDDARNAVITTPEVYAPTGSDVLAGDRLVVRGQTFDVEGDPADWRSPFTGWQAGLVIRLKKVAG